MLSVGAASPVHICMFMHKKHEKPQSFVHPSRTLDAVQEPQIPIASPRCRGPVNERHPMVSHLSRKADLETFQLASSIEKSMIENISTIFPPDLVPSTCAPRRLAIAVTPTPGGPRPRAVSVLDVERSARGHQQPRAAQAAAAGSPTKGRATWEAREAPRPKKPRGESSMDRSVGRAISGQRGYTTRSRSFVQ